MLVEVPPEAEGAPSPHIKWDESTPESLLQKAFLRPEKPDKNGDYRLDARLHPGLYRLYLMTPPGVALTAEFTMPGGGLKKMELRPDLPARTEWQPATVEPGPEPGRHKFSAVREIEGPGMALGATSASATGAVISVDWCFRAGKALEGDPFGNSGWPVRNGCFPVEHENYPGGVHYYGPQDRYVEHNWYEVPRATSVGYGGIWTIASADSKIEGMLGVMRYETPGVGQVAGGQPPSKDPAAGQSPPRPVAPASGPGSGSVTMSEIGLKVSLGKLSARRVNKSRGFSAKLTALRPLGAITSTLTQGRRRVGRGSLPRLRGSGAIKIRVKGRVRSGRYRLSLETRDAQGKHISQSLIVQIGR
jgi:hypothetical protein